jgi:hypothetical protein
MNSLGALEEVPQSDTAYFPVAPFQSRHRTVEDTTWSIKLAAVAIFGGCWIENG